MIRKYLSMYFFITLAFMLIFSNCAFAEDGLEGETALEDKAMNLLKKVGIDFEEDEYENNRYNNFYSPTGQKIPNAHEGEPTASFDFLNSMTPKLKIDFKTQEEREESKKKSKKTTNKKSATKQKTNINLDSVK